MSLYLLVSMQVATDLRHVALYEQFGIVVILVRERCVYQTDQPYWFQLWNGINDIAALQSQSWWRVQPDHDSFI